MGCNYASNGGDTNHMDKNSLIVRTQFPFDNKDKESSLEELTIKMRSVEMLCNYAEERALSLTLTNHGTS